MFGTRKRLREVLHDPPLSEPFSPPLGWSPRVETTESPTEYTVTAEVPGLEPDDIAVECDEKTLTMRGSKSVSAADRARHYHLWEREYGAFERTIAIPRVVGSDRISADLGSGVLTVHLPKSGHGPTRMRRIEVSPKPPSPR